MIDVEFYGEQKIIDAWADLFAHFKTDANSQGVTEAEQLRRGLEKYASLLYEIGQSLGYKIGKTHIRDDVYRPDLHNEFDLIELETRRLTRDLLKALDSMDALPVRFQPPQGTKDSSTGATSLSIAAQRKPEVNN